MDQLETQLSTALAQVDTGSGTRNGRVRIRARAFSGMRSFSGGRARTDMPVNSRFFFFALQRDYDSTKMGCSNLIFVQIKRGLGIHWRHQMFISRGNDCDIVD